MDSHAGLGTSSIFMATGVPQATMDPFDLALETKKESRHGKLGELKKKPKLQIMKHQSLSPKQKSVKGGFYCIILVTFCLWFMLVACEPFELWKR